MNETQSNDSTLIVGGTNLPQIDWEAMSTLQDENSTEFTFIEAIKDALLTQHIKEPTRLTDRDKASLLDVMMSDIVLKDLDITLEAPIGKSDHVLVKTDVPVNRVKSKCKNRRNYEKGDYHGMRNHLADPKVQLNTWEKLKNCMKELVEKFVTLFKIRSSGNQMPLARAVRMKVKEKNKAWKTFKNYQTADNLTKNKTKRNEVRSATQSEALTREKEISSEVKTNPKKFWSYVRQNTTIREAIPALIKPNGMLTDTDDEKAEVLSNFFASVFTDEPLGNWEISPPPTASIDDNLELTMNDIREELNQLDTSKSPGPDGIHPRVLFELREFILKPLLIIFQTSWETNKLPEDWKLANISAIFEKGKKSMADNYRPISLTSICCKLFEKFVRKHLMDHFNEKGLIKNAQYGFRSGRSLNLPLLKVIDDFTGAMDRH